MTQNRPSLLFVQQAYKDYLLFFKQPDWSIHWVFIFHFMSLYFRIINFVFILQHMEHDLWNSLSLKQDKFFFFNLLALPPFWVSDHYFDTKFLFKFEFNFLQLYFLCERKTTILIICQWKSAKAVDVSASCFINYAQF